MHFFVTGASGFVGGYITSHLLAEGHTVTALVRTPGQARALAEYGVRPQIGDLLERESLRRGMVRVDGVFHAAGWHRFQGRRFRKIAEAINVIGTRNVLEVMAEMRVARGVYTSDLAVFGNTRGEEVDESYRHDGRLPSVYARTKWQAHYRVALPMMHDGLPLIVVMPGRVYGPGDTSQGGERFARYLRGRGSVVPMRTEHNWAHASDIAWGHLRAMERGRPGRTYIIGGPRHTVREVFGRAGRLAGKRRDPLPVPGWLLRGAAAGVGGLSWPFPTLSGAAERLRASTVGSLGSDARARKELGFDPRPIAEGLPDTVRSVLEELLDEVG